MLFARRCCTATATGTHPVTDCLQASLPRGLAEHVKLGFGGELGVTREQLNQASLPAWQGAVGSGPSELLAVGPAAGLPASLCADTGHLPSG